MEAFRSLLAKDIFFLYQWLSTWLVTKPFCKVVKPVFWNIEYLPWTEENKEIAK
jgi:hypothetical protein